MDAEGRRHAVLILDQIHLRKISIRRKADALWLGPKERLDEELAARVREHKAALLDYLDEIKRENHGAEEDEENDDPAEERTNYRLVAELHAANLALIRLWLRDDPNLTNAELSIRFSDLGIRVHPGGTMRHYRKELGR